jgi:hypothetical protein
MGVNKRSLKSLKGFSDVEIKFLKSLHTPQKIQDYLDSIPANFEPNGDECRSPAQVLRTRTAHCIEAAMFAAMVLRIQGHKALIVDLTANKKDNDHVIAVFKMNNRWGAIAKSNHYCNGYRDPIYLTIRELVMSYFHEYLNYAGEKTLRSYAGPLDLAKFDNINWMTAEEDIWEIPTALVRLPHKKLFAKGTEAKLRNADEFIRRINNIERYSPGSKEQFLPPYGLRKEKGDRNM